MEIEHDINDIKITISNILTQNNITIATIVNLSPRILSLQISNNILTQNNDRCGAISHLLILCATELNHRLRGGRGRRGGQGKEKSAH